MDTHFNALGQAVGAPLPDWSPPAFPPHEAIHGRSCRLEPLNARVHTASLFRNFSKDVGGAMWTYLPSGPFKDIHEFAVWIETCSTKSDPQFYAIVNVQSSEAVGIATYMRIDPANGCIEVGYLAFSPALQQTTAATEAMYLMMRNIFQLGYRRYEWKCNSLNQPSCRAALRLGFTFEGIFRQAVVTKGRNRDTAWYSVIDSEWPDLRTKFERWLSEDNFDADGKQRKSLKDV